MKHIYYNSLCFFVLLFLLLPSKSFSVNYVSNSTGNWNNALAWTPNGIPGALDNATISVGNTITVNVASSCTNITVNGTLNWTGGIILAVSGNVTLNAGGTITGTATGTITNTGTFIANGGTIGRNTMTVAGTSTYNGVVTYNNTNGTQTCNGTTTFNNGSGMTFSTTHTTTFNAAVTTNGTVTISGTAIGTVPINSTLTASAGSTFNIASANVTVSGATTDNGAINFSGPTVITGIFNNTLTVSAGATFGVGSTNLTVTGVTTNNGTIVYNDAIGTKTLSTLNNNAGATWNCSGYDMTFKMTGSLSNNGTFNASATTVGPNLYQFTSGVASFTGSATIPHIQVNGGGILTNNGILTITDSLFGTGQYVQGSASTLLYASPNLIVVSTFNPSMNPNLVDYDYAGAQTIKGGGAATAFYYNLNCSNTGDKTLGANTTVKNNVLVQNTAELDAGATSFSLTVGGNWSLTSTNAAPFLPESGLVTFNGSALQALITSVAAGQNFYDVTYNNTSAASPNITTAQNINVSHNTLFTLGNMDLQGQNYIITGDSATTDRFSAGTIFTSVAGSNFIVTDPNRSKIIYFWGTKIGTAVNGITFNVTSGRIQFQNFTEYGTATFTKTLNIDDVFGGGNYYHGPVTFTAAVTASRWRMGDNVVAAHSVPDTFCNATFNALADSGSNNNFIVGANSLGNAFYGTTHMTSVTPGGFYVDRFNDSGTASCEFHGPVVASIGLTGNMTFCNAGVNHANLVIFDSSITLNSTATSTGYYNFANGNVYGTVILNTGGQFLTGSISGQTNVYLNNVTQYGPLTQTINTSGSTGALFVGGVTATPAYKCVFNGPCNFTADTAGYFVGSTFNGNTNINVNHPNANGYIVSDSFNANCTAVVGDIRFEKTIFGGTTLLQHTSAFTSSSNGGNTFNGTTTIQNLGTGILRQGGWNGLGDAFYGNVTFVQNGAGATLSPAYGVPSTFAGNISTAGSTGTPIIFASGNGTMVVNGSGIQLFQNVGSPIPTIVNLTMSTTAPTNDLQFNFSTSVTGTLNLTQGLINLNANTLTLGVSAAANGTLSYTSGWLYGGTFTRWVKTTAIPISTVGGLFPMGSAPAQNDYQPLWFSSSANLTTSGTISVSHPTTGPGLSPAAFFDASWGNWVIGVSVATWQVSSGNGLAIAGATGELRYGGNGFTPFAAVNIGSSLAASVVGNYSPATSVNVPLEVSRTALTTAMVNNTWYISSDYIGSSPLPVELLNFDAELNNQGSVNITWSTASQINNKLFTVEKTQDGVTFDTVATVAGAGNSTQLLNYTALDENPFMGTSYYRLQQTDFDGNYTFSSLVPINVTGRSGLVILPNPVHSTLTFNYTSPVAGPAEVKIIDASGRTVFTNMISMQQGINTYSYNVDGFARGSYYLQLSYTNTLVNSKLIIQ